MDSSILNNVKEVCGIKSEYEAFDAQLLTNINYTLGVLAQIGISPVTGLVIVDKESKWELFGLNDSQLGLLRMYVSLKAKLVFDPPTTSYLLKAMQDQVLELETRLSYSVEVNALNVENELPEITSPPSNNVSGLLLGGM